MINLDSILKSRDITLLTKVGIVKAMVFPVAMYRCESWTIKKAEHQRTDAFELWCWRTLESSMDGKIKPFNTNTWIFIGRTNAEREAPILWSPDMKNWLIRRDPEVMVSCEPVTPEQRKEDAFTEGKGHYEGDSKKNLWFFIGWVLAGKEASFFLFGSAIIVGYESSALWSPDSNWGFWFFFYKCL